jgi:hypothetical protein
MRPAGKSHLAKRTLWRAGVTEHLALPCGTFGKVVDFETSASFDWEDQDDKAHAFSRRAAHADPKKPLPGVRSGDHACRG